MVHGCPRSACPQISFDGIEALRVRNHGTVGPLVLDNASTSVHFEFLNSSGHRHQIWFDNPATLAAKYAWAAKAGLRGVGIFETTMIARCSKESMAAMWEALRYFKVE